MEQAFSCLGGGKLLNHNAEGSGDAIIVTLHLLHADY